MRCSVVVNTVQKERGFYVAKKKGFYVALKNISTKHRICKIVRQTVPKILSRKSELR